MERHKKKKNNRNTRTAKNEKILFYHFTIIIDFNILLFLFIGIPT